jgi:hypothetical protein
MPLSVHKLSRVQILASINQKAGQIWQGLDGFSEAIVGVPPHVE